MTAVTKKLLAVSVAAVLAVAAVAETATAAPTGEFAQFAQCQYTNPALNDCVYVSTNGGSLKLGAKTISLKNPITLQGGYSGASPEILFYAATNGVTLSKTPQPVPGGTTGLTASASWPLWLQESFNDVVETGLTGVTVTMELAAPAAAIKLDYEAWLFEEGTALGLPVKFKLDNAFFGSNCYIGSNSEPITINLTTGESGVLTGSAGALSFNGAFTLMTLKGWRLVNNDFAAPNANGCGGIASEYVNPFVDSIFELPASVGENRLTFEGVFTDGEREAVFLSGP